MCVLSFDDGMLAESWYAEFALRIRVRKSAIGSVIVMSGGASLAAVPHALGPRRLGARASRRSVLLRWGVLPGTLADAGQLAGVSHLPQADPAQAELAVDRVGAAAALAAGVAADRELRLAGRLVDESLLGHLCCLLPRLSGSCSRRFARRTGRRAGGGGRDPRGSAVRVPDGLPGDRKAEPAEQLATLVVGRGGGDQRDVHATRPVDPVDVDLAEHRLLGQPERVVAVPVELLGVQAAEVADAGQRERQEAVEELPHAVTAEGDLGADRHALAQLELRDGLAGADDGGLLAGDGRQVADGAVHQLRVAGRLADAHVDDDLGQPRDLHDVDVAELGLQGRRDLLAVVAEQPGQLTGGCTHGSQRSLPVRRETRIVRPSSSLRSPTRVGL